ncbi:MAG TPA: anaerobic carbon-monoxide dehydrogenase catalytic subunit [Desulfomonilia bacterium]|nr:anaerobic carbon-monoxide dehydrogenase catalytic subunit [Desulfomonilia bacterium]
MDDTRKKAEERACDPASIEAIRKAERDCIDLSFFRMDSQKSQCTYGTKGLCCRICHMGPCRITAKAPLGVCGADADTIVARNFLREVAGGSAAHSDHGRHLVLLLKKIGLGNGGGYTIKDEAALRRTAHAYGIDEDMPAPELAVRLAEVLINEYTSQEDRLETLKLAPVNRQGVWLKREVGPAGIDRMIVEAMHRTHMGVDHDYKNILMHAFRLALADGWGGSRIASMVSDVLFGTPTPVRSTANLGILGERTVNVLVHGHEPALSEMLAAASADPEIKAYAKQQGAQGITLAGICCTANEILMRHGIPLAGNFLQQELAIVTGAVEMMLIDVQCCMPSLPDVAKAYHTEIVSTSSMARTVGATPSTFDTDHAYEIAKGLLKRACDNYKNRDPDKVAIPRHSQPLIAGFCVQSIKYMLGGTFRASFRPLNDAVIQGRIRGVVCIVGCNNPKTRLDSYINTLTKELLRENVLVLKTGCAAIASAKEGNLTPEAAFELAGPGLREVCEAVGMPPVLHMGSCVDNTRLLEAATEIVAEGGLGEDLSDVPVVGVAPEWMSEKAIAIGCYFVASGIDVVLGNPFYVSGSENVSRFLNREASEVFGASFHVHEDPHEAALAILLIIDARREKLGINKKAERKLMDMKDRRELGV